MATVPVATAARLLGMHPKTLHHWLKAAQFPLTAHPTAARLKGVAEEHLLALARTAWSPAVGSFLGSHTGEIRRVFFSRRARQASAGP
jgi:transposase-like protein